jgi:hypothetical protein
MNLSAWAAAPSGGDALRHAGRTSGGQIGSTPWTSRCASMNAIMVSTGGRAPPPQNRPTLCVGSRWPGGVHGSLVPAPSSGPARHWSTHAGSLRHAPPADPISAVSRPCNQSLPRSSQSLPNARRGRHRAPAPSAPHGRTSGEYRTDVFCFSIAPSSQGSGPPGKPVRFRPGRPDNLGEHPYVAWPGRTPDCTRQSLGGGKAR